MILGNLLVEDEEIEFEINVERGLEFDMFLLSLHKSLNDFIAGRTVTIFKDEEGAD